MSNVITKDDLAKIAISKNLIKEYKSSDSDRTVYLNDGTEFQIYLKNPFQNHLGIKIYVNNKSIGNMLVLRPGQSFWLDRFVDQNSKFLFSTYQVEDTGEMRYAINNNGRVKIEFYHEKEQVYVNPSITWINHNGYETYGSSICGSASNQYFSSMSDVKLTSSCEFGPSAITSASASYSADTAAPAAARSRSLKKNIDNGANKLVDQNLSLETGRVEKGGKSDQEFERCDIDFEYYAFKTENILILPNSRKQIRVEETRRKYCSQCGKKVSPKDKFCSNCGAKLN
jgi:hypothetical protein